MQGERNEEPPPHARGQTDVAEQVVRAVAVRPQPYREGVLEQKPRCKFRRRGDERGERGIAQKAQDVARIGLLAEKGFAEQGADEQERGAVHRAERQGEKTPVDVRAVGEYEPQFFQNPAEKGKEKEQRDCGGQFPAALCVKGTHICSVCPFRGDLSAAEENHKKGPLRLRSFVCFILFRKPS